MKKEITIPEQLHRLKPEELEAAAKRRENYSISRDLQSKAFNDAIMHRFVKEKEMEKEKIENVQTEAEKQIRCDKCGMEFSTGISMKGTMACPDCNSKIKIE